MGMLKLSDINLLVEGILEEAPGEKNKKILANELVIYAKTFMLMETYGLDRALSYYFGTHNEDEYQEYRTSVCSADVSLCRSCNCMTHSSLDGFCMKCRKGKIEDE